MKKKQKIYAVITGDILGSSQFKKAEREQLTLYLSKCLEELERLLPNSVIYQDFSIYRGDSFQGVIIKPEYALRAAIYVRLALKNAVNSPLKTALDCRIAIGVGTIDYLPDNVTEGDGEAFKNSGLLLDNLKKHECLAIKTENVKLNNEFSVTFALVDFIISNCSAKQAEALIEFLQGKTQVQIAGKLNTSQSAIHKRLNDAGHIAINKALNRFELLIKNNNA